MAIAKAKWELVDKQENSGLVRRVEKSNIVGLVSHAWNQSFAWVESNQKAVAKHGWGPLKYNLLMHPEINLDKKQTLQARLQSSC
jgi:hypothetical protein